MTTMMQIGIVRNRGTFWRVCFPLILVVHHSGVHTTPAQQHLCFNMLHVSSRSFVGAIPHDTQLIASHPLNRCQTCSSHW